jgi:hypothetical protein
MTSNCCRSRTRTPWGGIVFVSYNSWAGDVPLDNVHSGVGSRSEPAGEVKKVVGKAFTFGVSCQNRLSVEQ